MNTRRFWLCLPPVFTYTLDVMLTLLGQPKSYWLGDHASACELNPLALLLLTWHPLIAVAAAVAWALLFCAVLFFWRSSWSLVLAFGLTFGHAIGASTWLVRFGLSGYVLVILLLIVSERLLAWSWRRVE